MSTTMDRQYRNKSELLLPVVPWLKRFPLPPEIVDLTEQELVTLGFLGDSELLSSLHTHAHLAHS